MDDQRAQRFAEQWYAAWNSRDLAAILEHYADDVEMASPLVSTLTGRDGGRIVGKDALRAYFTAGLEKYPALHFEPIELFVGVAVSCSTIGPAAASRQRSSSSTARRGSPGTSRITPAHSAAGHLSRGGGG